VRCWVDCAAARREGGWAGGICAGGDGERNYLLIYADGDDCQLGNLPKKLGKEVTF
jgi:hypothetical protein